jgi:hypothetical protein
MCYPRHAQQLAFTSRSARILRFAMPETPQRRRNTMVWLGLAFMALTVLGTIPPSYRFAPAALLNWISLLSPFAAVACFVVALRRAFAQPAIYRGKVTASVLGALALLLLAGAVFLFIHARDVPPSPSAPKVGQKAPAFVLVNTSGQNISLNQLLSLPIDSSTGKPPKAVLLVFYRGHW